MFRHFILLTILLFFFQPAQAWLLKGKVIDDTGEPLPYANVYLENTTIGVITNIKGEYFLELEKGTHTVVFQSLGYTKQSIEIVMDDHKELDVVMVTEALEMEDVVVTAGRKDPAYAIMKKVIENKRRYIKQFESFQCETYLKVSLERDSTEKQIAAVAKARLEKAKKDSIAQDSLLQDSLNGITNLDSLNPVVPTPEIDTAGSESDSTSVAESDSAASKTPKRQKLNFIESFSTTYYQHPGTWKSIVHAFRDMTEEQRSVTGIVMTEEGIEARDFQRTPDNPYLFYRDVSDANFNFYENLVSAPDLGDRPFISPLSSTAWRATYKYKLEDQFLENGRVTYKIKVTPRLKYGPYFEGHIYIVDEIWAIKSVNLKIVPATLSFFNYFQVLHNYEMTDDDRWTLKREDYYYNIKEGKDRYYGNSIAIHDDYKLDVVFPKRHFRNELRRVEDDARDLDSTWWDERRPITLKRAEKTFITEQDSIIAYHTSPKYLRKQDSLFNQIKFWDPFLNGIGIRRRASGMEYFINPLIAQLRPFGVGGYRHAPGGYVTKEWKNYKKLFVAGEVDYGFTNHDVRGNVKVSFTYKPKKFAKAHIKYGNVYSLVNNNATIAAVLSRGNFVNKRYYGFGNEFEISNGLFLDVEAEYADYRSIDQLALAQWSQDLFGSNNTPQSFDEFSQAKIDVRLKFTPGQKYYSEPNRKINLGSKWPTFTLRYKKAIPGIFGSNINYDFIQLSTNHEFRPGTMGVTRWSTRMGTYLNQEKLLFTDYQFFRGSDPFLFASPLRAFNLLGQTLATPNAYFQGNYLHDFGGALLDKVPLIRRTNFQTAFGGGVLFVDDQDFFHAEVFGGLQYALKIKGQRFKIGAYYVSSYSNKADAIGSQIKFGVSFFDTFKNKWSY